MQWLTVCLPFALRTAQWEELIERCQETGVDAFEINFSCPHGMPERKMGMAMGQVGWLAGWMRAKIAALDEVGWGHIHPA